MPKSGEKPKVNNVTAADFLYPTSDLSDSQRASVNRDVDRYNADAAKARAIIRKKISYT